MYYLDSTTKNIEVYLGSAVAANQLPITCAYEDITTSTFTPGEYDTLTSNTSAITAIMAPGASTQRRVKSIDVYNADTAAANVYCRYNNSGTTKILTKAALPPQGVLQWTPSTGWNVPVWTSTGQGVDGISTIIEVKRYTAATWTSNNPTLAQGEIGFETDTSRFKIGDGATAWNSLQYYSCKVRSVSGSTSITMLDDVVSSTATATFTLPATAGTGKLLTFKNLASSQSAPCLITLTPAGSDKIDGASTFVLDNINDWITIRDTSTGVWTIVSYNASQHTHQIYSFGDSLTVGQAGSGGTYDPTLQTNLGNAWTYNDLGINGSNTADGLARFASVTGPGDAEYVIIDIGICDLCFTTPPNSAATIESNLAAMYLAAHNAGIKVVACTISPFGGYSGWNSTIQATATTVNAWINAKPANVDYVVDVFTALVDSGSQHGQGGYYYLNAAYDSGDGLHWNSCL